MIDLGDTVALTFTVKDTTGALADDPSAAVTITLPDGSTAAPAVSHAGTGTYNASYVPTQAGRHVVRWTSTGAGTATAYTDVFNVSAADPGMIVGLAEARTAVGLPTAATAKDDVLRGYIATATPLMEDLCGPILSRTVTDTHDGGGLVRLMWAPVISVTSVKESYGNFTRTLTEQPLDGATFDAYGYTVDLTTGILTRRISGRAGAFPPGRRNVLVTYKAGRAVIGENLIRATQRLIRWLWEPEQGATRPDVNSSDTTVMSRTPSGYTIPRDVITLCGADVRIDGLG